MESLKDFTVKIQKFYELVESHESEVQSWIKEARKPIHSITNQSVFYRAAVPEDSVKGTPLEKFEGFRESLVEIIFTALQDEYEILEKIRDNINTANEKLHKEQISVESYYSKLRSKNLMNSDSVNPCCPSFEHIVDWCHDIWCYYHSYYLQITQALNNLIFEDESTVKALAESFKENTKLKKPINRIRSFQFSQFEFII